MDSSPFRDEDLRKFHAEFIAHVEQYNHDKSEDKDRFTNLFEAQEKNTQAIAELIEETRGVIELQKNIQAAAKLGNDVQRLSIWVAKWPVIGVGLYAIYEYLMRYVK